MPLPATDTVKARLMDAADVDRTLNRLARQIVEHLDDSSVVVGGEVEPVERLALVGMQTRGVHIARRLRDKIEAFEGIRLPFGVLDATLYRDDYRKRLRHPVVQPTDIPFDVDGRRLMSDMDQIDAGVNRGIKDRHDLIAGQREQPIHARCFQRLNQYVSATNHIWHLLPETDVAVERTGFDASLHVPVEHNGKR